MKNKFFTTFSFIMLIFIISFFVSQKVALAWYGAPIVTYIDGDDINLNGGTDDPYDSLIVFKIEVDDLVLVEQFFAMNPSGSLDYTFQYSYNGTDWIEGITAVYETVDVYNRIYYWSTSNISNAPILWLKASYTLSDGLGGSEDSEVYQTNELSLSHRVTDNNSKFFVEPFIDEDYNDTGLTTASWTTTPAWLEAGKVASDYSDSVVYSKNLLDTGTHATVTSVTVQPVQYWFNQDIDYFVSNNGSIWEPVIFNSDIVPTAQTILFESSYNNQLFWKADININNPAFTPRIYQMRLDWEENTLPQACFVAEPYVFPLPTKQFLLKAYCSGDLEDDFTDLKFRWDWESDGIYDYPAGGGWGTGAGFYDFVKIFDTTTTRTVTLDVRDTVQGIDSYQTVLNGEDYSGDIYGWLWGGYLSRDDLGYGWTSLNCDNIYGGMPINFCQGSNYGLTINGSDIEGWAWNSYLGWLCFGNTCDPYGLTPITNDDPFATLSLADGEVNGWAKFIMPDWDPLGWLALRDGGLGDWCDDAAPETDLCVRLNIGDRSFQGYAWGGGTDADPLEQIGPGWQSFDWGQINLPWLETLYGTIYDRSLSGPSGGITEPPTGRYTATYCILSNGTISSNFTSAIGCTEESYEPPFEYPAIGNQFRNILGIIDEERILDGSERTYSTADIDLELPDILNGEVHYFAGDAIIDNPFIIYNAQDFDSSGAGTIYINGSLIINSNFYYEDVVTTSQIENLASVAWIVKGDVIIDSAVSNIAGTFIVLGDDGAFTDGVFSTGDDSALPRQLVVSGLVMATEINFERVYQATGEPAEQIIYDGRVLVNTPPGLADFSKAMPNWRATITDTALE